MKNIEKKEAHSGFRIILGIVFLLISLAGLYWVAEVIYQLWNSPKTVPFVTMFIELLEDNQLPILKSREGAEINLPASWPVVVGVFLSIVLISSIGVIIKLFLSKSLQLLFPANGVDG
jgi:hypothetical protein